MKFGEFIKRLMNLISLLMTATFFSGLLVANFWQEILTSDKIELVKNILEESDGSKTIQIDQSKHEIKWRFKNRGTSANVYIFNDGKNEFAIKIGKRAIKFKTAPDLLHHSIEGVIPIWSFDRFNIDDNLISVITMPSMENEWIDGLKNKSERVGLKEYLSFGLSSLIRLVQAAKGLEEKGLIHDNIGAPNVMFDKDEQVFLVDIDNLISTSDSFADYKKITMMGALNQLLGVILSIRYQDRKDASYKKINEFMLESMSGSPSLENYLDGLKKQFAEL